SDFLNHSVSQALTGLSASTTYHYRLVATHCDGCDAGTTAGADQTFTTSAAPVQQQPPAEEPPTQQSPVVEQGSSEQPATTPPADNGPAPGQLLFAGLQTGGIFSGEVNVPKPGSTLDITLLATGTAARAAKSKPVVFGHLVKKGVK